MKSRLWISICLALVAGFGCADPTKDKPKAAVDAPAPEPSRAAGGSQYELTDESSVGFVGSKVTGSHDGGFEVFGGIVNVVDGDPTRSSVEIEIDTTSLWSDNEKLTGHLKSADFFDVEKYPTAKFTSTEIRKDGERHTIVGNLTLHGVTKSISFPADITVSPERVSASAEFAIKRFDFGIEYPGRADDLIRDDVLIKLDVIATPSGA